MADENPYESPQTTAKPRSAHPVVLLWCLVTVFGSSALGGMIGLGIGAGLGTFKPNYYRTIFSTPDDENFDAIAVGIGQGLTQGIVFGAVVGLAIAALFLWYNSRVSRRDR